MSEQPTPLYCGECGDECEPAASIGDSHRCSDCFARWEEVMREIEAHEARIADVPHIRMLNHG